MSSHEPRSIDAARSSETKELSTHLLGVLRAEFEPILGIAKRLIEGGDPADQANLSVAANLSSSGGERFTAGENGANELRSLSVSGGSPHRGSEEESPLEARRRSFLQRYNIKVLSESQISFSLPAGTSRLDLIDEAQTIAAASFRQNAIYPTLLAAWREDPAFISKSAKSVTRAIDGCVRGSTNLSRREQENQGWNNVELWDLAAAHAAYFVASGKDLFDDKVVRGRGGAFRFGNLGLSGGHVGDSYDAARGASAAASAVLSSDNDRSRRFWPLCLIFR